jgi:hypothetical protein
LKIYMFRVFDLNAGALMNTISAGPVEIWTIALHPQMKNVI